jgi:hypothetical protein
MANQEASTKDSKQNQGSKTDQILDLLLDALLERQRVRQKLGQGEIIPAPAPVEKSTTAPVPPPGPEPSAAEQRRVQARPAPARKAPPVKPPKPPQPGEDGWQPPPRQPSINMGKMLGRLAILVAVLLILVNIPVTRYGVSLARIMPETASLIIRDGLVLKGNGPEIYILEQDKLRWISSMDAFEHMGLTWEDVHIVEDEFLTKFEKGASIHVLLKCRTSPHIYRLENGEKRWIRDIDTFEAEGHVWDDVRFVSCNYLRDLPDGVPIPEDAGSPPQP